MQRPPGHGAPPPQHGCAHYVGIGCVVLLVLGVVASIVISYKAGDWARSLGSMGVKMVAEHMFDELDIPEDERAKSMPHIRDFADRIDNGAVSVEQIAKVAEQFLEGPAFAAILCRGFQVKYLPGSGLAEDEKSEADKTISRFAEGFRIGSIDKKKLEEVGKIVTESHRGRDDSKGFKERLTDDELRKALGIMKSAADAAGVSDELHSIDVAAAIKSAIDTGIAKGGAGSGTP